MGKAAGGPPLADDITQGARGRQRRLKGTEGIARSGALPVLCRKSSRQAATSSGVVRTEAVCRRAISG